MTSGQTQKLPLDIFKATMSNDEFTLYVKNWNETHLDQTILSITQIPASYFNECRMDLSPLEKKIKGDAAMQDLLQCTVQAVWSGMTMKEILLILCNTLLMVKREQPFDSTFVQHAKNRISKQDLLALELSPELMQMLAEYNFLFLLFFKIK